MTRERTIWLIALLLLVAVLVPAFSILWVITETARRETAAAQRTLTDAYRGQLRLIHDRVDAFWSDRGAELSARPGATPASEFRRVVDAGLADAVVMLDAEGRPSYPRGSNATVLDARTPAWREAEALELRGSRWIEAADAYARIADHEPSDAAAASAAQAAVRCAVKSGDRAAALRAIEKYFADGRLARSLDRGGRLVAADEWLLAIRLLSAEDARVASSVDRLVNLVNDYDGAAMPASQRLFLMNELLTLGDYAARLPTHRAEQLAAAFLETDAPLSHEQGFHRTRASDVWAFAPSGGGVVGLYRTPTLLASLRHLVEEQSTPFVAFTVAPPSSPVPEDSMAAAGVLTDWRIAFAVADPGPADKLARQRVTTYAAAGLFMIGVISVCAVLVGRSFSRQLYLASLKTDLVAAVSHELKTPLSSMRLLVESLLDDAVLEPRKVRDYLQLIAAENLRLSRVIDNFLTFSRIERNRQQFTFSGIAPDRIVASAVEAVRERFQRASCHVEIDAPSGLPLVRADEDAVVTALLNLLDNAFKYTPAHKQIVLHAYRDGASVVFSVQDNGVGISPKEQRRIFRRFYRVDQRLARETGGCGLGLSIVDYIARAHGGRVTVRSREGAGSTFLMSLPCMDVQESAA